MALKRLEPSVETSEGTTNGRRKDVLIEERQVAEESDVGQADAVAENEGAGMWGVQAGERKEGKEDVKEKGKGKN